MNHRKIIIASLIIASCTTAYAENKVNNTPATATSVNNKQLTPAQATTLGTIIPAQQNAVSNIAIPNASQNNIVPAQPSSTIATSPAPKKITDPSELAVIKSLTWANNKSAKPTLDKDGKIIFVYGESRPTIICAPLYVCDVALEPGEIVDNVNAGDKVRWSIMPAMSGISSNKTVHLVIKALDYDLETNVVVTTDRRTYYLRLLSPAQGQGKPLYVTRAGFYYPENEEKAWKAQQAAMAKEDATVVSDLPNVSLDQINFNYDISGNSGTQYFKPVRVFDDGSKVFIQMPSSFQHREAPALVLMGKDGKEQLVNYRLKDDYYIVDKLFDKAALILGVGSDQRRVTIAHCAQRGFFGNCVG